MKKIYLKSLLFLFNSSSYNYYENINTFYLFFIYMRNKAIKKILPQALLKNKLRHNPQELEFLEEYKMKLQHVLDKQYR